MFQTSGKYVMVPEAGNGTGNESAIRAGDSHDAQARVLPEGIARLGKGVLVARHALTPQLEGLCSAYGARGNAQAPQAARAARAVDDVHAADDAASPPSAQQPALIAAYDFDGTSISGNSPVLLVYHMVRQGMLSKSVVARIVLWGLAYKCRLPQKESWVRAQVFSAFEGKPVSCVNEYLHRFYDKSISGRFRPRIIDSMRQHLSEGHVVVCVSATFEPIIAQAMCEQPIQFGIATRMKIDVHNRYNAQVEGLPVEGEEKIAALSAFADDFFGKDCWKLGWAYGDHHSDRTLLAAAEHAYAVTPDRPLTRTARECGYEILEWDD